VLRLRSNAITAPSSLLHATPSLCPASVLGSSWGFHLDVSLGIGATGSHVPHKSLKQGHAAFMPDAIWAVDRYLPDLSRANEAHPVLTPSMHFSTRLQRFAHARLLASHLTGSSPAFSSTLTTIALYDSSLRWFEACSCKPASRGQPSSPVQHGCLGSA
jgi:hypothetical protein